MSPDKLTVHILHQVLCNFSSHKNANNNLIYLTRMSSFLGAACLDGFVLHGNGTEESILPEND